MVRRQTEHLAIVDKANGLTADENGIWTAPRRPPFRYPEDGNQRCFQREDASFWFRHGNRCTLSAIKRYPLPGPILDIGSGNGYVTRAILHEGFDVALLGPDRVTESKDVPSLADLIVNIAERMNPVASWEPA